MLNGTIMVPPRDSPATVVRIERMRDLSSNSHRIPTLRRIMGGMGIAWKVLVGVVLLIPMTAYVVGSLVAAADEPRQHDPIIIEERTKAPEQPRQSPSAKPSPGDDRRDDHSGPRGGHDDTNSPEVITPSPDDDLFDDHGGDRDDDDDDNSGKGSDDNSGKGSDDD
jgi:hypothetical protein